MLQVVEAIRVDMDFHRYYNCIYSRMDILSLFLNISCREEKLDHFRLPKWLKNEFSISEIKLFIHHFKTIDIDGGGTIDAEVFC